MFWNIYKAMNDDSTDAIRRKLRYRAWHMGTRELDFICGNYADQSLPIMDETSLIAFTKMLKIPDTELQKILLSPTLPDKLPDIAEPHRDMLRIIINWRQARNHQFNE